jgi:hypothetical protein
VITREEFPIGAEKFAARRRPFSDRPGNAPGHGNCCAEGGYLGGFWPENGRPAMDRAVDSEVSFSSKPASTGTL